jgi:hypothetical protein
MDEGRAIDLIRAEYVRAVGPMGHVLIDEVLADLGLSTDQIPGEKLPELIEKLGWEVHSERRRVAFQKAALEHLQSMR